VKLWVVLALVAVVCAVTIGAVLRHQQRMTMLDRLDSSDPAERMAAIGYWFDGNMSEPGRLSKSPAMLGLLEERSGGFSSASLARIFEEVVRPRDGEWSTLGHKAPRTFYRSIIASVERSPRDAELRREADTKLDLALQQGLRAGGYGLVWDVADAEERELILETFLTISRATAADPEAAHINIATTALSLIGQDALPVLEPMLDAVNEESRRQAWLHLAAMRPESGYTARWREAPHQVAEAMIAASVVLSNDPDASIDRFRQDAGTDFGGVLDALGALPRDAEGRIDLASEDWPETSPEARLVADLRKAHESASFALSRVRAFRVRDGTAPGP
jgi:hypothetical protein